MRLCLPSYLAQRELDVGKLLLERLVHVLLQIGGLDVLHHGGLQRHQETSVSGSGVAARAGATSTLTHFSRCQPYTAV